MPEPILPPDELISCERTGALEPWAGHLECACERLYQVRDESAPGYPAGPCRCGRHVVGPEATAWRICRCGYFSRLAESISCPPWRSEREITTRAEERAEEVRRVEAWNASHPVGSEVEYQSDDRTPRWKRTTTTSAAWIGRDGGGYVRLAADTLPKYLAGVRDVPTSAEEDAEGLELGRVTDPCDMAPLVASMTSEEP